MRRRGHTEESDREQNLEFGSRGDSFRNRYLAGRARVDGYATMRLDLLTSQERHHPADDVSRRLEVSRLARRLITVCESARRDELPGCDRIVLASSGVGVAAEHVTSWFDRIGRRIRR